MKKKDSKKEEKAEKMAKGGCVKMAAGGAAKSRRGGFDGIKKAPLPTAKKK